jgi:hypothetical protein
MNCDRWVSFKRTEVREGWIGQHKINWELHPTSTYYSDDRDDCIRSDACDQSVFELRGSHEKVVPPCVLVPMPHLPVYELSVEISLKAITVFSLAGLQCHLWLGEALPALYDFYLDPTLGLRAKHLELREGDAFLFIAHGERVAVGVAVLHKRLNVDRFLTSLYGV